MPKVARSRWTWIAAAVLAAAALVVVPVAFAASPAYPPKARVFGKKMTDWTAEWYQWAYGMPEFQSVFYDDTGSLSPLGQRGKVWFLGGAYEETTPGAFIANRSITIPEGKALLFPVMTTQLDNVGSATVRDATSLYAEVAAFSAAVDPQSLVFEVDGVDLTDLLRRRVKSSVFEYTVGPGTFPIAFGALEGDVVYPAVSDGYWVMLKPLAVGVIHTIHVAGAVGGPYNYTQDINYVITVVATD